ncbi:MAG TPA: two-component regulator propeller domain-containing protein, partial [Bacteroidales bacterium]|nr:two-component regulator propeller domain-containing protein [Bacteroidales bacterium]
MKKGLWVTGMLLLNMISGLCQPVRFEKVTSEEGLSHNNVNCVIKDSEGFMWFGTDNGLNRYDGYTIREYQHDPEDSTTISGKGISCLFEDSRGNLWAGTSGEGLNRYRRETDDFIRFTRQEQDTGTISHNWIMCMFEDSQGRLWIGTQNGLNRYDYSNGTFTWYLTDIASIDMPSQLRRSSITDIGEDSHGNLWITTWVGLHFFNPDNSKSLFYSQFTAPDIFKTDRLESIHIDQEDNLWIGARGYLHRVSFRYRYDTALLETKDYRFLKLGASVLMTDIEPASKERLWLGTGRGLALFDKKAGTARFFTIN